MATPEDRPAKSKKLPAKDAASVQSPLERLKGFTGEVSAEFSKIVWPGRKQTVASTLVVLVLVMMMSLYLGAVDLLLGKIIGYILR